MLRLSLPALCCLCLTQAGCKFSPRAASVNAPGGPRVSWVTLADGGVIKLVGPTTISFEANTPPRRGIIYVSNTEDLAGLNAEADAVMDWYRPFAEQDGDKWIGLQAVVRGGIRPGEANDSYRSPYERDETGAWHYAGSRPTTRPASAEKLVPPPSPDFTRDAAAEQEAVASALRSLQTDAGGPTRTVHSVRSIGSPDTRPAGPYIDIDFLMEPTPGKVVVQTVSMVRKDGSWGRAKP